MLGRLMGRRRSPGEGDGEQTSGQAGHDEPIIHQTVPEEVLNPEGVREALQDTSWMDEVPLSDAPKPNGGNGARRENGGSTPPQPRRRPVTRSPETPDTPANGAAAAKAVANASGLRPNTAPAGKPRFPHGWLVVIEGPGTGEWFVLERGVSHIGSAEGQTVRLGFGDEDIAPERHAALVYDADSHAFVLDAGGGHPVRLNGLPADAQAMLRDGDVISVGATSLRLVSLCSPNFNWESERAPL